MLLVDSLIDSVTDLTPTTEVQELEAAEAQALSVGSQAIWAVNAGSTFCESTLVMVGVDGAAGFSPTAAQRFLTSWYVVPLGITEYETTVVKPVGCELTI